MLNAPSGRRASTLSQPAAIVHTGRSQRVHTAQGLPANTIKEKPRRSGALVASTSIGMNHRWERRMYSRASRSTEQSPRGSAAAGVRTLMLGHPPWVSDGAYSSPAPA
jgi:hypothetical protein